MEKKTFIGFEEALKLTLSHVPTLPAEVVPLSRLAGRTLARDLFSVVDSPSAHVSLKDGFAVVSEDLRNVDASRPVKLRLRGAAAAGDAEGGLLVRGEAVRVTTGAPIPEGADAVLSEEFSEKSGEGILCLRGVEAAQNVLGKGTDIRAGELAAKKGEPLSPATVGLLASAGLGEAAVFGVPRVIVIGTGDEVLSPGTPLAPGKLYASNVIEVCAWLSLFGIPSRMELVRDRVEEIEGVVRGHLSGSDAFVTSGGIWGSERDLMTRVLQEMGWRPLYHRVRMGPGKAIAFGLLEGRPFFCLPGGPPSNEMAFLQLALPGILAMQGRRHPPFPVIKARLRESVTGEKSWTQFIHARVARNGEEISVSPERLRSRLRSMAEKDALIRIPEGREEWRESEEIPVQLLVPLIQAHDLFTD